jgi:hypothetical protein
VLVSRSIRDVTERKRTAQEVQAARVYAEAIVETVREPLAVAAQSGNG